MSQKAAREKAENRIAVAMIAISSTTISASATPGRCSPKNIPDQSTLSANCNKNSANAGRAPDTPASRHTSHALTAINRYKTDQTGPNTQPGGVSRGLRSPAYHVLTESAVTAEPSHAAPKQRTTKNNNAIRFLNTGVPSPHNGSQRAAPLFSPGGKR